MLLLRAAEFWEGLSLDDMAAFAQFVKCRLGVSETAPAPRKTLTWVWRKSYLRFRGPNGGKLARLVLNEDEVRQFLDQYTNRLDIAHVDFAQMSFAEQVAVSAKTDIMVGVHGAGLVNCLYMRPGLRLAFYLLSFIIVKGGEGCLPPRAGAA